MRAAVSRPTLPASSAPWPTPRKIDLRQDACPQVTHRDRFSYDDLTSAFGAKRWAARQSRLPRSKMTKAESATMASQFARPRERGNQSAYALP
jgi:hypothetical protein